MRVRVKRRISLSVSKRVVPCPTVSGEMISNEPRLYLSVLSLSQSQVTMGSGHLENYEARPRSASRTGRADYCDDPRRRWKNSLRPLDPGLS